MTVVIAHIKETKDYIITMVLAPINAIKDVIISEVIAVINKSKIYEKNKSSKNNDSNNNDHEVGIDQLNVYKDFLIIIYTLHIDS